MDDPADGGCERHRPPRLSGRERAAGMLSRYRIQRPGRLSALDHRLHHASGGSHRPDGSGGGRSRDRSHVGGQLRGRGWLRGGALGRRHVLSPHRHRQSARERHELPRRRRDDQHEVLVQRACEERWRVLLSLEQCERHRRHHAPERAVRDGCRPVDQHVGRRHLDRQLDQRRWVPRRALHRRWSDNSGVEDGYEVWISYSTYCYYYCYWYSYSIASLPANSTAYTVTGADYTGVYFVVATKDGGYSDFSDGVTPSPPPGAASASASAASRTAPRPVPRHRVPPTRRP